jgi:uncharacterized protein YjiS (DUF1127 family)
MTMTIPAGGLRSARRPAFLDAARAALSAHRRRREHRLALQQLARLGPRLLADTGIDPALVQASTDPWEHLPPNGLLMQR